MSSFITNTSVGDLLHDLIKQINSLKECQSSDMITISELQSDLELALTKIKKQKKRRRKYINEIEKDNLQLSQRTVQLSDSLRKIKTELKTYREYMPQRLRLEKVIDEALKPLTYKNDISTNKRHSEIYPFESLPLRHMPPIVFDNCMKLIQFRNSFNSENSKIKKS